MNNFLQMNDQKLTQTGQTIVTNIVFCTKLGTKMHWEASKVIKYKQDWYFKVKPPMKYTFYPSISTYMCVY